MDRYTFQARHPQLYAELIAEGVRVERVRVMLHLELGKGSGDLATAFAAIESGEEVTETHRAIYMAAVANRPTNQPTN